MTPSSLARLVTVMLSISAAVACAAPPETPDGKLKQDAKDPIAEREERLKQLEKQDSTIALAVKGPVQVPAAFTELPASKAFAFLEDAHHIEIVLGDGAFHEQRLTVDVGKLTLRELLDRIGRQLGIDWDTDGHVIYVGHEEDLKEFRKLLKSRDARRKKYPEAVAGRLKDELTHGLEFRSQQLDGIAAYFGSVTKVSIRLANEPQLKEKQIKLVLENVSVDVALDLITLQLGLTWTVSENGTVTVAEDKK